MSKLFFTARWEYLVLVTYKADPGLLEKYLPRGLTIDTIDNSAFISLVAFSFFDTKVKGLKVPFHINFPEINLRFYVKEKGTAGRRGVVFIREFVPRTMITRIANALYNENYRTHPMSSFIEINSGNLQCRYNIKFSRNDFFIKINAEDKPFIPPVDSIEHFLKEHEWGFGNTKQGNKLAYKVEHPHWYIYPVKNFEHNFDYEIIYGKKWKFINDLKPFNITFAKGSPVKVYSAEK